MTPTSLTRVVVDLEAIRHNVRLLRAHVSSRAQLMAVVKANAYGHGAVPVARAALQAGATWCGVASVAEGIALRAAGIQAPILVMSYTPLEWVEEAIQHRLSLTVFERAVVREISRRAWQLRCPARVHVEIDTGMHRLGVLPHEAQPFLAEVAALEGVVLEGVFTHLSRADADTEYTEAQIQTFCSAIGQVPVRYCHICNSAGVLGYPHAHLDLVRPGITLYGLSPYASSTPEHPLVRALRPALSLTTSIVSLKWLPDGAWVGYGKRHQCNGHRRIAVIPVGYGDGFRYMPNHFGEVLVRGRRTPIVGAVCMDHTMLDVTDLPEVSIGDEVVLIGTQGNECITADEVARRWGTINYEVVTALTARPHRVYVNAQP
ncbi:MAG: alanine racemase [Thermoflexales bacterium]|nr:alanine racemase [Thermoflexales bacterium]